MPLWMTLAFLSLVSALAYALSAYVTARLGVSCAHFELISLQSLLLSPALDLALALLSAAYFMVGTLLTPRQPLVRALAWLSSLWLGLLTCLALWAALAQLIGLVAPLKALNLWPLGALLMWFYGTWRATQAPRLVRLEVPIKDLDERLDGLTLVQLSDIHIGPTLGERFAQQLAERTLALKPDLIVVTGDLVDGSVERLKADVAPLLAMRAPLGVYFVTGNHELISNATPWVEHVKQEGWRVLENSAVTLNREGALLNIAGVEDWEGARFPSPRPPSLSAALSQCDSSAPTVLLAHQPKVAAEASERGVALQLSGHTHGGQIFPFTALVALDQPYRAGRYQVGELCLYVSEGTGYWGPPLRVGTRAELTHITLRAPTRDS